MKIKFDPVNHFIKLIAVALIGLIFIFEIPYIFPPSVRVVSASYDYGFNNMVGILILFVFCIVFVGFGYYLTRKESAVIIIDLNMKPKDIGVRAIFVTSLVSFLLIATLFLLSGSYGFGESTQFVLAMERLSIGQALYSDFDFYYGPLLAYVPYAIYKGGYFLNFEYKTAYFLGLAALQFLSLVELRYILNNTSLPLSLKQNFFYVIAFSTLPFHSGINLILFRFITPVVGFIFIKKYEEKSLLLQSAIFIALSFLIFGISIEYGVVFSVALCVYLLMSLVINRTAGSAILIIITMASPVVLYGLSPEIFHSMQLYLQGAWRWPFVLSLQLILFFISVFVVAFLMGSKLRDFRKNYYLISLCILAIGSLPASLGRCDPGHVLLNGLMIFIVAYTFISFTWNKKHVMTMYLLFILSFGIFYNYTTIRVYSAIYMNQAYKKIGQVIPDRMMSTFIDFGSIISGLREDEIINKIDKFKGRKAPDYNLIFKKINKISSPYMLSEDVTKFLSKTNKIELLYFKDFSILASEPEVDLAIDDMKKKDPEFLILPIWWDKISDAEDNEKVINFLFTTKYTRMPIRNGRMLLSPIDTYFRDNYILDAQFESFVIMKRLAAR
jgi:hypothetical protein